MATRIHAPDSRVKLAAPELPAGVRSGGENLPLDYPHLYQIQAGDWRISYAVEHNRLAILVLEVLNPPGGASPKDPTHEKMTRKMKVKLLDWPEGSGTSQLPAEEISKKLKIKWLDLKPDVADGEIEAPASASRIKLKGSSLAASSGTRKTITLLDSGEVKEEDETMDTQQDGEEPEDGRKTTPLDEPSM